MFFGSTPRRTMMSRQAIAAAPAPDTAILTSEAVFGRSAAHFSRTWSLATLREDFFSLGLEKRAELPL